MSERERVRAAFMAELEDNPGKAPGVKAIAERMGLRNTRNLNGRVTKERTRLLEEHGFAKQDWRVGGRWVKP
ncbi:hypothetical protein SEA_KARATE_6 [Microbacterium phage Karate]|nr:hypothetical protein SEA_KARATE_6 [Microbacterium phage Karate]